MLSQDEEGGEDGEEENYDSVDVAVSSPTSQSKNEVNTVGLLNGYLLIQLMLGHLFNIPLSTLPYTLPHTTTSMIQSIDMFSERVLYQFYHT